MDIDKKTFVKEKLKNFILHVKKTFGEKNILLQEYAKFIDVENGFEPFINALLQIGKLLYIPMDDEKKKQDNMERITAFFKFKGLEANEEDTFKFLRYIEMFYLIF